VHDSRLWVELVGRDRLRSQSLDAGTTKLDPSSPFVKRSCKDSMQRGESFDAALCFKLYSQRLLGKASNPGRRYRAMYRVGGTKTGPERTMLQLQEPKKKRTKKMKKMKRRGGRITAPPRELDMQASATVTSTRGWGWQTGLVGEAGRAREFPWTAGAPSCRIHTDETAIRVRRCQ
jgi:hypothetical protein